MFFVAANAKINEIYDGSQAEQVIKFNERYASVLGSQVRDSAKVEEATKTVTAVKPGHLYLIVTALHGDEPNDNGDYFRWDELLKKKIGGKHDGFYMFETWKECPVLENHNMGNIRGQILDCWPNREDKSIEMLLEIDENKNPNMVQGIRSGSITGTSMGVMVDHSYCSVCGNVAYDESGWCFHLSPKKGNLKGRIYRGQDNNKYPDKIGQMVYEDNRGLTGVEDSIITLGEPADPKALTKKVLATNQGNDEMNPRSADVRAGISNGIVNYTKTVDGDSKDKRVASMPSGGRLNDQLNSALQRVLSKNGKWLSPSQAIKSANAISLETPNDVLKAINDGSLRKAEAIAYVEEFNLATAKEMDEMTPAKAVELLKRSVIHDKTLAELEHGDQALSESEAKPEDAPKPQGTVNVDSQIPSNDTSDLAISESDASPSDKGPKPEGSVEPHGQMPGEHSNMNVKKTEEQGQPTPKTSKKTKAQGEMPGSGSSDLAVSESEAKPGEQPAPKGSVNPKDQMPSDCADLAVSESEAKPGEQPNPKKTTADHVTPESLDDMNITEKLKEALDLINDVQLLMKDVKIELPEVKKEKKPKEKKEDSKEEKSEPKSEDKGEDKEKKPEDKEEKKEDTPEDTGLATAVPMPDIFSYKVEYINDSKYPLDSYYLASLKNVPVLQITAKHAFGDTAKENLDSFKSEEYKNLLKNTLNALGAKNTFTKKFGSRGIILAQEDKLPDDTFTPPTDKATEPAGPMTVSDDAAVNVGNDDHKQTDFEDIVLKALSLALAADPSTSIDEAKSFLQKLAEQDNLNDFGGKLEKEIEHSKSDKMQKDNPTMDASSPTPLDNGPGPEGSNSKMEEMANSYTAISNKVKELLPKFKKTLAERDEYKAKLDEIYKREAIRARTTETLKFAGKKAELGLIDSNEVQKEAVRLAKLSEEDYKLELSAFENSVKIASKMSQKSDYINIEGNSKDTKQPLGTVLASIPSQVDEVPKNVTFQWSVGAHKRS